MAGGAELLQPVDLGRQRQAGPSGLDHQQHRQVQRIGQMPGTGGITHAAQSIVKAHGTLAHGCPVPGGGLRIERAHGLRRGEKQVEVVALHPQHGPVKHGVDIVRPALEGAGVLPPPLERRQQSAGQCGFAAAGTGRGHKKLDHLRSPVIRKMGLLAISRWSLPAGRVRLTAICVTSAARRRSAFPAQWQRCRCGRSDSGQAPCSPQPPCPPWSRR